MSHFPVLVIGDHPERFLAPYHEFECTGYDDEYVQTIDETEEYRENYEEDTKRMLVSPEGERYEYYDERFYTKVPTEEERIKSGRDPGENFHEVPEGWTEQVVPAKDLMTFTEWVREHESTVDGERPWELHPGQEKTEDHKYRYIEFDENDEVVRIIRRTNPNKKWDFWVLGGRWSRYFKLKPEAEFNIDHVGGGDLYTKEGSFDPEHFNENDPWFKKNREEWVAKLIEAHSTDHAQVKDIDFEATRDRAEARAREQFTKWREIYEEHGKPLPFEHFKELAAVEVKKLEEAGIADEQVKSLFHDYKVSRARQAKERAGQAYREQPAIKAEQKAHLTSWRTSPMEYFGYDEEAFAQKARRKAMVPYAVIKDGKWYAKGDMGWWGMSDDHLTEEEWIEKVHELYADLPDDEWLTLVDCHI